MKALLLSILILASAVSNAYAQACCSAGTPLSAQMGLEFLDKGDLQFNLAYDHNLLNDQFSGTEKLDDEGRSRLSQTLLARIAYAFSSRFSVAASLPYIKRSEDITFEIRDFDNLSSQGIGDLLLQANFVLLQKNAHQLMLSGGIKLPTGSNSEKNEFSFDLPADLQPGTGSTDFVIASLYEINNIINGNFHLNFSAVARLNGEGERFDGRQSYSFGNAFLFIAGINYEQLLKRSYLIPSLNLSYRRTYADRINGAIAPSTGGDWISLVPGLAYYRSGFKAFLSAGIPVFRYLEGTQLTTTYRVYFQLQYTLKTRNEVKI